LTRALAVFQSGREHVGAALEEPGVQGGATVSRSVVVVEDHPTVREGLCLVLEREGFSVVERNGTVAEGHDAVVRARPDVALIDVNLPDGSGVELARRLLRRDKRLGVLLYTGLEDLDVLEDALESGARGFVLKTSEPATTLRAVHAVAVGGTFVDPGVRELLAQRDDAGPERVLTVREREVLGRLAEGLSVEEIAADLVLSTETIRTHVRNAMSKLGAHTRAHAIVVAVRRNEIAL
jgi:DNA-binding NarL/FixJ family response regulator